MDSVLKLLGFRYSDGKYVLKLANGEIRVVTKDGVLEFGVDSVVRIQADGCKPIVVSGTTF